jgi:hypothetical protein
MTYVMVSTFRSDIALRSSTKRRRAFGRFSFGQIYRPDPGFDIGLG